MKKSKLKKSESQRIRNDTITMLLDPRFYLVCIVLFGMMIGMVFYVQIPTNSIDYESDTGIIIDKTEIQIDKTLFSQGGHIFYTIVDCDGVNKTIAYSREF